jgi:hypothetical protein
LARPQVVCTPVMTWGVPMWFTTNGFEKGVGGVVYGQRPCMVYPSLRLIEHLTPSLVILHFCVIYINLLKSAGLLI